MAMSSNTDFMRRHNPFGNYRFTGTPGEPPSPTDCCSVCSFKADQSGYVGDRYTGPWVRGAVSKFQAAGEAGCPSCTMILQAVEEFSPGWIARHSEDGDDAKIICRGFSNVTLVSTKEPGRLSFSIFMAHGFAHRHTPKRGPTNYSEKFWAVSNRFEMPSSLEIVANAGSDKAFDRVSFWYNRCLALHSKCKPPQPEFTPTRVLDLSTTSQDGILVLNTEDRSQTESLGPYACLSYCWGQDLDGVVKTTRASLSTFQRGIDVATLPKTIRDAIRVCENLGLSYLWVDSLCIVQDDADDWARESEQMCEIYSNSHITVAAGSASSAKEGFLGEQVFGSPSWQREFKTTFGGRCRDADGDKMLIRIPGCDSLDRPCSRPETPLETRGWTLQEMVLPSRVLHYTGHELAWECNTEHFCECGRKTHVNECPWDHSNTFKTTFRGVNLKGAGPWCENLCDEGWKAMIREFTKRRLTFQSDRLHAIKGMARMVQSTFPGDTDLDPGYAFGMFRHSFEKLLFWWATTPERAPPARVSPLIAPTWSWASAESQVDFVQLQLTKNWSCFSYDANAIFSSSPGMKHSSRELVLTGKTVPVELRLHADPGQSGGDSAEPKLEWRAFAANGAEARVYPDEDLGAGSNSQLPGLLTPKAQAFYFAQPVTRDGACPTQNGKEKAEFRAYP
ncbi:hypothetical protein OQA88_1831 [Cercophora sp. LCS_1]